MRNADFTTVTRNHTEDSATQDAARIPGRALMLLERTDVGKYPVRPLGPWLYGVCHTDEARTIPESLPLQENLVL